MQDLQELYFYSYSSQVAIEDQAAYPKVSQIALNTGVWATEWATNQEWRGPGGINLNLKVEFCK